MVRSIPTFLRSPLEDLDGRLRARFGARLREIRLFGSHARGEAGPDSDVDVLVVVDDLTDSEIGVVATIGTHVLLRHDVPIAVLPMSTARLEGLRRAERALAANLDRDGIPL
jgi:predicted nucleotidyltransferase